MSRRKRRKWRADMEAKVAAMQARHGKVDPNKAKDREAKEREHWEQVCAQIYSEFRTDLVSEGRTVDQIVEKYDELKRTLRQRIKHRPTLNTAIKKIHDACQELKVFSMIPKQKNPELQ